MLVVDVTLFKVCESLKTKYREEKGERNKVGHYATARRRSRVAELSDLYGQYLPRLGVLPFEHDAHIDTISCYLTYSLILHDGNRVERSVIKDQDNGSIGISAY